MIFSLRKISSDTIAKAKGRLQNLQYSEAIPINLKFERLSGFTEPDEKFTESAFLERFARFGDF